MKMKLKWQRGEVDLVTVAVSLTILSIIVAGTGSAMIYGRDALLREELAKQVSYRMRGEMEKHMQRLDIYADARTFSELSATKSTVETIDWMSNDGASAPVTVRIRRLPVESIDYPETSQSPDFYNIKVVAEYEEPALAGDRTETGRLRRLELQSAFVTTRQG